MKKNVTLRSLLLAGFVVALGVAPTSANARVRPRGRPTSPIAQASSDCDGDGDPADTLDPLECGSSAEQPEPKKLYTKGEKQKFKETADAYRRSFNDICGAKGEVFLFRAAIAFAISGGSFTLLCNGLAFQVQQYEALAADPPDQDVFTVALPMRPKKPRGSSAAGRRYLEAVSQKAAFGAALATSLNRLSSTPDKPEEVTALPVPKYSRRLQVGAGRLYSGLVAAWVERESKARASMLAFIGRHSAADRRRAAAALPKSAKAKGLWAAFESLTAPEYAQLTADLYEQTVEAKFEAAIEAIVAKSGGAPTPQAQKEVAELSPVMEAARARRDALFADLGAMLDSSESSSPKLGPSAKAAIKDAAKLGKVPGLSRYAPQAGLMVRLVSFGGGAFLPGKPKAVPVG